ncbi:MAG: type IV pilus biogenesis/stability protein PilW [Xanthomonadaceae bacterium]|nr:type IV pilus biogenesis/stability protein PilW [Xanthomonadaceae bacterium]
MLVLTGCASSSPVEQPRRSGSTVDRVSPNRAAELNTRLGVGYLERGNVEIALEKLQLAVRLDPKHAPAHLAIGIVYDSIGRDSQALKHLKTAVELAPGDGAAHNSLAAVLCEAGRYDEADKQFKAALEDPFYSTPDVVLANAGACARRGGKDSTAERYLRDALSIDPANRSALFNLSQMYYSQGNALQARAFLQRLESTGQMGPASLLLGYRIERALTSEETAKRYATLLETRYPESPQASEMRQQNK